MREYCDGNYHQILPIIAEKVHQEKVQQEKLKAVKAHLNFEETSRHSESGTPIKRRGLKERLRPRHVGSRSGSPEPRRDRPESPKRKGPERKEVFKRLEKVAAETLKVATKTLVREQQSPLPRGVIPREHPQEERNPLKKKAAREAMPTWCHMFNSTLAGNARVWFDDLPKEIINSYNDLKKAFLENYLQQKKCIKDTVEILNIRQRDGESTEEFVRSRLRLEIRKQLIPATTPLIGFSGEIIWPIGQIQLLVKIGDEEHSASAWINFMVILVEGGVITLKSSKLVPLECAVVSEPKGAPSATKPKIEERIKVAINPEYPEQTVMIGSTLTEEGRNKLCGLLQRNLDIFAWNPADMTGVPRHIVEHRLNVKGGCLRV
ncbi:reverse transcriptase domain-containing protein [Tanacetum coccineum]|uniref:Reverse transcriptase domain-containing protein n=1 Tax=Tanacetum coccineum TaxID=301880 RepID=A0ABQ5DW78_9ASTR